MKTIEQWIDENAPEYEISNIVTEILFSHKKKWNGDDEIQDIVLEAFLRGVKYWKEKLEEK